MKKGLLKNKRIKQKFSLKKVWDTLQLQELSHKYYLLSPHRFQVVRFRCECEVNQVHNLKDSTA